MLIDATVIRVILLPATMKLLGDKNWYLPRWLDWLPKVAPERGEGSTSQGVLPVGAPCQCRQLAA